MPTTSPAPAQPRATQRSSVLRLLALLFAAALLVGGCSGSGEPAAAGSSTPSAAPESTPPAESGSDDADDEDCDVDDEDCAVWDDDWDYAFAASWQDDGWAEYWDEWDDYDWGDGWDEYCDDEGAADDDAGGCHGAEEGRYPAGDAAAAPQPEKSGPRPDAPEPTVTVIGTDNGPIDTLVAAGLSDIFEFWESIFPATFDAEYEAPGSLVSYSSAARGTVCEQETYEFENAFFDSDCDAIAWDRGVLLPQISRDVGTLAPIVIIAHEVGHDVQYLLHLPDDAGVLVAEQQADCYAGAYWRWVVDGQSKYFAFDQADGVRQLMLGLLSVKDPQLSAEELAEESEEDAADVHGSGFDRTFAGAQGYTAGAARCNQIDAQELAARGQIQDALFNASAYGKGDLAITDTTVQGIAATLNAFYRGSQPGYRKPALVKAPSRRTACQQATLTGPVVYCAATNTVSYHLPSLAKIGTPVNEAAMGGDFSAFALLASRYALAAAQARQGAVTGASAGLAALCTTGTWARWMRAPRGEYQLSPWDLDKAIYQIIDSPLAGSDASGEAAAPVISRVASFGYGITHTVSQCTAKYGN